MWGETRTRGRHKPRRGRVIVGERGPAIARFHGRRGSPRCAGSRPLGPAAQRIAAGPPSRGMYRGVARRGIGVAPRSRAARAPRTRSATARAGARCRAVSAGEGIDIDALARETDGSPAAEGGRKEGLRSARHVEDAERVVNLFACERSAEAGAPGSWNGHSTRRAVRDHAHCNRGSTTLKGTTGGPRLETAGRSALADLAVVEDAWSPAAQLSRLRTATTFGLTRASSGGG